MSTLQIYLSATVLVIGMLVFSLYLPVVFAGESPLEDYYIDWKTTSPKAEGHLSISCPRIMEDNQTYQIDVGVSLETTDFGDRANFSQIQWLLLNQGSNDSVILGYSILDPIPKIHQEVSTISHWFLNHSQMNGTGILAMNATIVFYDSQKPLLNLSSSDIELSLPISISLRNESSIFLSAAKENLTIGEKANLEGTIMPSYSGALINLTFVKPNGDKVTRWVISDNAGNFSDSFALDAKGNWLLQASWAGNDYISVEPSKMILLNVEEQGNLIPVLTLIVFLSVVGGMAAIKLINPRKNFNVNRERTKN